MTDDPTLGGLLGPLPKQPSEDDPARPLFSSRYGLVKQPWGRDHWVARHQDHGDVSFGCCPPDPRRACACPGVGGHRQCCATATTEDLLCDACREHCVAVDSAGTYHRLIDVYPPTGTPERRPDRATRVGEWGLE